MSHRSEEDPRFSAIYSSIDGEEYEAYVEVANAPAPYLVPASSSLPREKPQGLFSMKKSSSNLPYVPSRPRNRPPPPPSKGPPTLPQKRESYHHRGKPNKQPQPKPRAGTPANKMAETPLELGFISKQSSLHPDHLPLLDTGPNIKGKLHPASTSCDSDKPPQRLTGNKYKALQADAETNEYASLKPLRRFKTDKLRERLRIKKTRREGKKQLEETQDSNIYGNIDPPQENLSDNSRTVCLLLSIIIVCLLLSITSLIIAVYTIASFEQYKAAHHTEVEKCNYNGNHQHTVKKWMCPENETALESQNAEGMNVSLSCQVVVNMDLHNDTVLTSYVVENSDGEDSAPYCMCTVYTRAVPPSAPLDRDAVFSCIVTKTTSEVNSDAV